MLSFSISENAAARMKEVNSFRYGVLEMNLVSFDFDQDYQKRTAWYGGSKYWKGHLHVGAINYLPLDEFITHLKTVLWNDTASVQLIIREEEEIRYKIIDLFDPIERIE
jgi:hypothetical protein